MLTLHRCGAARIIAPDACMRHGHGVTGSLAVADIELTAQPNAIKVIVSGCLTTDEKS